MSFHSALTQIGSSLSYINRSINLRIENNNNIKNSLFTDQRLSIDFNELNWFNFESLWLVRYKFVVKLSVIGLLYPPDDLELYKCPKCNEDLRRYEDQKRILGCR